MAATPTGRQDLIPSCIFLGFYPVDSILITMVRTTVRCRNQSRQQLAPERPKYSPCQQLWAAMLHLCLHDACSQAATMVDRQSALDWIASNDNKVSSFLWVCDILNLQPTIVREKFYDNIKGSSRKGRIR